MSGFGDGEEFLDADASESHTIGPRLDRHHVAGSKNVWRPRIHPRRFVNEKPNSVADAVRELAFKTCRGQHRATGRIDFATRDARTYGRHPRFAGAANNIMTQAHYIGARAIDDERASHVGVVSVDQCSEIDHHCVATTELAVGRVMVRKCGVGSRGDDRRKTHVVGTQPAHRRIEFIAKLALGRAGNDEWRRLGECRVGDHCGSLNSLEFGKALGAPQIGQH